MKTMKAGAVVLLGLVLAAPAWSAPQLPSWAGGVRFNVDPDDPLRCEVSFNIILPGVEEVWLEVVEFRPAPLFGERTLLEETVYTFDPPVSVSAGRSETVSCGRLAWSTDYAVRMGISCGYGCEPGYVGRKNVFETSGAIQPHRSLYLSHRSRSRPHHHRNRKPRNRSLKPRSRKRARLSCVVTISPSCRRCRGRSPATKALPTIGYASRIRDRKASASPSRAGTRRA